jgi:hypothetical protein
VTPRCTEFAAFVLDALGFMEEKILEATGRALARRRHRRGRRRHPVLRDCLRENEVVQANFILVLSKMIEQCWVSQWRDDFSKMERGEFERTARDLVGRLAILRTLATEAGAS